jgi:[ribosomal protein S5]-alanine N-acetyltransferase
MLNTHRLLFCPATLADHEALYDLFGDKEVMKRVDVGFAHPRAFTYVETGQWIQNHLSLDIAPWKIVLKESGEVIGWGGIAYCSEDQAPQAELLYFFKPKHWGKGYATETAAVAIAYGFGFDYISSIEATVDPANPSSIRVLEKMGMLWIGGTKTGRLIYSIDRSHYSCSVNVEH